MLASKDARSDIWLRLQQPSSRYKRFQTPFLWVSTLGKHVIDYMNDQPRATVGLESCKNDFHRWLMHRFNSNHSFREWFAASGKSSDFRVAFNAYVDFFYNQAVNLPTSKHLISHPVWAHCKCNGAVAIERQPNLVKDTLATPHVYECFKSMYFASKLKEASPSAPVRKRQRKRKRMLGFADERATPFPSGRHDNKDNSSTSRVRVGDVVSIIPDAADTTKWQNSGNEWLAYIQGVEASKTGAQRLMVLWLYRPIDTNMYCANYPITNELYLSDNCNCGEREILVTDVIRKHNVEWSPRSLNTTKDFFIRQTYLTQDSAFVTVSDDHAVCSCRNPKSSTVNWRAGDTVYITKRVNGQKLLEPVLIHELDYTTKATKVRKLLRLGRDCADLARKANRNNIAPNELVLTRNLETISLSRIQRACKVRFVQQTDLLNDRIPFPYSLRGVGDHWFVSMGIDSTDDVQRLVFLDRLPKRFHDARAALFPHKKLRGLSLFSGGGGLDRGLEEGGAVEFQTTVDYDSAAIHTQRANCRDPQRLRLFCGSVDDYVHLLLSGRESILVANVGEVELIAAGSPCPGTSWSTYSSGFTVC